MMQAMPVKIRTATVQQTMAPMLTAIMQARMLMATAQLTTVLMLTAITPVRIIMATVRPTAAATLTATVQTMPDRMLTAMKRQSQTAAISMATT